MKPQSRSLVIGAFIFGSSLIAGTILLENSTQSTTLVQNESESLAIIEQAPERKILPVKDSDNDGIEDWQDSFLIAEPIINTKNASSSDYTEPDTLTGQMALSFMQNYLSGKVNGFGLDKTELVKKTVDKLKLEANDRVYNIKDLQITNDTSPTSTKHYGNALADAINANSLTDFNKSEMDILQEIVRKNDITDEDIGNLHKLANMYKNTLEDTLLIPTPKQYSKAHIDLINVYNSIYNDVVGMTLLVDDPVKALLRIKRYQEDLNGLHLAFKNIYTLLDKSPYIFNENDSASMFVAFAGNNVTP